MNVCDILVVVTFATSLVSFNKLYILIFCWSYYLKEKPFVFQGLRWADEHKWCWCQDRLRTLMSMVHSVEKMEHLLGISSSHDAGERMQYSRLSKIPNCLLIYNVCVTHSSPFSSQYVCCLLNSRHFLMLADLLYCEYLLLRLVACVILTLWICVLVDGSWCWFGLVVVALCTSTELYCAEPIWCWDG